MSRFRSIPRPLSSPGLLVTSGVAVVSGLVTLLIKVSVAVFGIEPAGMERLLGFAMLFQFITYLGLAGILGVCLWRNRKQVVAILYERVRRRRNKG